MALIEKQTKIDSLSSDLETRANMLASALDDVAERDQTVTDLETKVYQSS